MKRTRRITAALLALIMVLDITMPTVALALSSGPSQPEVQGFQPAGVNDMVDLFTGDFSYNIPLLDVEGYPVNLFYNAGIGMDQEASWVGLGWNLNPGVVERNLRGLPDDFKGDAIVREVGLKPNRTFGLSFGLGFQLLGSEKKKQQQPPTEERPRLKLNVGISPSFNNYHGPQFQTNVGMSLSATLPGGGTMTTGLGLSSTSNAGLKVRPSIGFDRKANETLDGARPGLNIGMSLDSRQGMTDMSFGITTKTSGVVKGEEGKALGKSFNRSGTASIGRSFDLGSPTYTPQVSMPMDNLSLSFNYTLGTEAGGTHPNMTLGASFSRQRLTSDKVIRPAYGYLHLHAGQATGRGSMLDFNREKDGPYSADRAGLGIASLTNDVFSVSGQGISGSYRAFRSEVGHVYDAATSCTGSGGDAGLEMGGGWAFHVGGNVMVNSSTTTSGDWGSGNLAGGRLRFRSLSDRPDLEPVFFREAGEATVEQDSMLWQELGKDRPLRFTLPYLGGYEHGLGAALTGSRHMALPAVNHRLKREPRAQVFSYLDHKAVSDGFGLNGISDDITDKAQDHHMSEVSITGRDGGRYVYGLPVYNVEQHDVEFNVDTENDVVGLEAEEDHRNIPIGEEFVTYSNRDVSTGNRKGRDHFFSRSITPAYPYAFLLTAVLSADYSDVDGEQGPSDGDLGNYTRFSYSRIPGLFPWRTPAKKIPTGPDFNSPHIAGVARWAKGLQSSGHDDKGSYTYGTKEVYHLRTIESRNFIAIFQVNTGGTRHDAMGVSETGSPSSDRSQYLERIDLYKKVPGLGVDEYQNLTTPPIKSVHFAYMDAGYSLCPDVPNADEGWGKLTLKRIWFTHGNSKMGVTTPYEFAYHDGPAYDMTKQDRWGNYKQHGPVRNDLFPYAEQGSAADENATAWKLATIRTPSGALIDIQYESDDYAYVQDRPAMRMLQLDAVGLGEGPLQVVCPGLVPDTEHLHCNNMLSFPLPEDCAGIVGDEKIIDALFGGVKELYFRVKVDLDAEVLAEYVSGYAPIGDIKIVGGKCRVTLQPIPMDEGNDDFKTNPIFRAAAEFMRLNHPSRIHKGAPDFDRDSFTKTLLYSFTSSVLGLLEKIGDFFITPNEEMLSKGFCNRIHPKESWIRVKEPDRVKKGGGYRVKSLRIRDQWNVMEPAEPAKAFDYGQDYTYGNAEGSYGVAAYEPMAGADENPWRQPVYGKRPTNALTPDERFYQETPFGESLFPSPVVGYSKVIVTDHFPDPGARVAQGSGRVVHEFHTARDFPTILAMTHAQPEPRGNQKTVDLASLLGFKRVDHMHMSQGYVVETNDMHGKPKAVSVYPEGGNEPISQTIYTYAEQQGGSGRLSNMATVITPQGNIGRAEIGRQYEFLADMREFSSYASSGGMELNADVIWVIVGLLPAYTPIPKLSSQSTKFKSGVLVKKVHRFGLLTSVTRIDNGSKVTTENLAYDSETGAVLLTKLNNAFEDPIYKFDLPAYWHYEAMGPAYRNLGAFAKLQFTSGRAGANNAPALFFPGDELAMRSGGTNIRGWVDRVEDDAVHVVDGEGEAVSGEWHVSVLRSGRRNMQDLHMMNLTLLSDPLQGLSGNVYDNIVQAQVQEFGGEWATECACFDAWNAPNAWRLNQKGAWRHWRERVWLTERTRSILNANTDIRRDGAYASFSPFYQVLNGRWSRNEGGWTTAREVTHYSARGQELENRDALGLYSSATFGYRGNLAKTVARNAQYREVGFDGFEETRGMMGLMDCSDRHFRMSGGDITDDDAHTGRYSLRVSQSTPASFRQGPWDCTDTPCPLSASISVHGNAITVTGATGAFTISAELVSGDVAFAVSPAGLNVSGASSWPWSATVTVSDDAGCRITRLLTHNATP